MKIAIIGSGSWGTALAAKSCLAGNETRLYCRNANLCSKISRTGENPDYLPGVKLPDTLQVYADPVSVMSEADIVFIVTPSIYVRETLLVLEPLFTKNMKVVCCAKGLERSSGKRLSEVLEEEIGHRTTHLAVLSGPNHAEEVGRNLPATTVIASADEETARTVQEALSSDLFRIYINTDMIGVELAGTTKNIIALAAGISDGLALGDNCKAALLTRGLHEMTKFGLAFGARPETYAGLAGMGDLVATCISGHSRNRSAGAKLAAGESMDYIVKHTNMVVEGFYAVPAVHKTALERQVDMPITRALYEVLYENKSPRQALNELMTRSLKNEVN